MKYDKQFRIKHNIKNKLNTGISINILKIDETVRYCQIYLFQ